MNIFAFWKHDQFPYVLGGEVVEFQGDKVRIKGYSGYLFRPIKIVDIDAGKKIYAQLQALEKERDIKLKEFNQEFEEKAKSIING